jgi:TonB family protein
MEGKPVADVPSFSSLATPKTNSGSFIVSAASNVALVLLFLAVGHSVQPMLVQKHYFVATLYGPPLPHVAPVKVALPAISKTVTPIVTPSPTPVSVQLPHLDAPKIARHQVQPEPGPPIVQPVLAAPVPAISTASTGIHVVLAPQPKAAMAVNDTQPHPHLDPVVKVAKAAFAQETVAHTNDKQVASAFTVHQATLQPAVAEQHRAGADSSRAELLSSPLPAYTEEAKGLRIQGDVVLRLRVGTDGSATVLQVVRGIGHGLDESAQKSVAQYRFKPAMRDGVAIEQIVTITVAFKLT